MCVVYTGVVPLVAIGGSREQEMGGVIDGRQGVVVFCVPGGDEELEGTSWVLRFSRAADGEGEAPEHEQLPALEQPVKVGGDRHVGLSQQTCSQGGRGLVQRVLEPAAGARGSSEILGGKSGKWTFQPSPVALFIRFVTRI